MPPGLGGALEFSMVFKATDEVSSVLGDIGQGLAGLIAQASGFQTTLTEVQTNTTLTAADIAVMQKAILSINAQSGAPLDQLATGFRNIDDIVGNVAASVDIARVASESATGSYTDQTTWAR